MSKPRFSRVWKLGRHVGRDGAFERQHSLFLCPLNVDEHPTQPEYTLLQRARLVRDLSGLRRGLTPGFGLDHDIEVEEFLGQSGHVVLEAERVLPDGVGRQDVVSLALALAVEEGLLVRVLDFEVDVERPSGLHLCNVGCYWPVSQASLDIANVLQSRTT